MSNKFEEKGNA